MSAEYELTVVEVPPLDAYLLVGLYEDTVEGVGAAAAHARGQGCSGLNDPDLPRETWVLVAQGQHVRQMDMSAHNHVEAMVGPTHKCSECAMLKIAQIADFH